MDTLCDPEPCVVESHFCEHLNANSAGVEVEVERHTESHHHHEYRNRIGNATASPGSPATTNGLSLSSPESSRGVSNDANPHNQDPWDIAGPAVVRKKNVWLELYGAHLHISDSPTAKTSRIVEMDTPGVRIAETQIGFDVETAPLTPPPSPTPQETQIPVPPAAPPAFSLFGRRCSSSTPGSPRRKTVVCVKLPGPAARGAWLEKLGHVVKVAGNAPGIRRRSSCDLYGTATSELSNNTSFLSSLGLRRRRSAKTFLGEEADAASSRPSSGGGILSRLFSTAEKDKLSKHSHIDAHSSRLSLDSEFEAILVNAEISEESVSNDSMVSSLQHLVFDWAAFTQREQIIDIYTQAFLPDCVGNKTAPTMDDFSRMCAIGSGSFSAVYKLRHHDSGRVCALKMVRKDRSSAAEVRALLALSHPFIVPLQGVVLDAETSTPTLEEMGHIGLLLPYLSGGELYKFVTRNYVSWERAGATEAVARFFASEITSALHHIHEKGFVYRDLKPENCVVNEAGHVILIDFGLCKKVRTGGMQPISNSSTERTDTFCGTPEYVSPELLKGNLVAAPTTDLWSLGCVLFFLLEGRALFQGVHPTHVYKAVLENPILLPNKLSEGSRSVLERLLQREPALRMQSCEVLMKAEFFEDVDWSALGEVAPPHRGLESRGRSMGSSRGGFPGSCVRSVSGFSWGGPEGSVGGGCFPGGEPGEAFADFSGHYLQSELSPVLQAHETMFPSSPLKIDV